MITKLEPGQRFLSEEGLPYVVLKETIRDLPWIKSAGATFAIQVAEDSVLSNDFFWYYGDGPLVGKFQSTIRTPLKPGQRKEDLVLTTPRPEPLQLSLFD